MLCLMGCGELRQGAKLCYNMRIPLIVAGLLGGSLTKKQPISVGRRGACALCGVGFVGGGRCCCLCELKLCAGCGAAAG